KMPWVSCWLPATSVMLRLTGPAGLSGTPEDAEVPLPPVPGAVHAVRKAAVPAASRPAAQRRDETPMEGTSPLSGVAGGPRRCRAAGGSRRRVAVVDGVHGGRGGPHDQVGGQLAVAGAV